MYIERVLAEMKVPGVLDTHKLLPCTEEEVYALEQKIHCLLPKAYKEFLLAMGKGADDILDGSDFFYEQIEDLQEAAVEVLTEDGFPQKLPEDAFVDQDYLFLFLTTIHIPHVKVAISLT